MNIVLAGAGAGKTSSMAKKVLDRYKDVTDGKVIYVITYTNAARDRIREKIIELNGSIPKQLFVETSHSFLLREVIFPFHHLIYDIQYTRASQIKLPDNHKFKNYKISELKKENIIHVEKVTEVSKWIIHGKSGDLKSVKVKRVKVLATIQRYLDSIFIDEAQDMDESLMKSIEVFDQIGINLYLVGDPKQDLRGRDIFRVLIENYKKDVEYKPENYRCPISHINLANLFINKEEKQIPQKSEMGKIDYVFECDINVANYIKDNHWNHIYILKKNVKFLTHFDAHRVAEENLSYELKSLVKKTGIIEKELKMKVYMLNKEISKILHEKTNTAIFNRIEELLSIKLTKVDMGRLGEALRLNRNNQVSKGILVQTIDKVKGLEGERCLFILTSDIAPYLFFEKVEQNKMVNYLYVALTRASHELIFLVTEEVEKKYSKELINFKLKSLLELR